MNNKEDKSNELLIPSKEIDWVKRYEFLRQSLNMSEAIQSLVKTVQSLADKSNAKENPIKVIYEMLCKINHPFHEYADCEAARDMALEINHIREYIAFEVLPAATSLESNEAIEFAKFIGNEHLEYDGNDIWWEFDLQQTESGYKSTTKNPKTTAELYKLFSGNEAEKVK